MKDIHTQTDELVRQRLNELPTPPPVTGWEALERTLDAAADAPLRAALGDLPAVPVPSWESLAEKLDARSPADQALAQELDALVPTVPAATWLALEHRLDEETGETVDAIVATGLEAAAPGHVSGWAALAARLELTGWRRETIAAWKITETALLASALLLFLRFGPPAAPAPVLAEAGFPVELAPPAPGNTVAVAELSDQGHAVAVSLLPDATDDIGFAIGTEPSVPTLKEGPDNPLWQPRSESEIHAANSPALIPATHSLHSPAAIPALALAPLERSANPPSPMITLSPADKSLPTHLYLNTFISPLEFNEVVTPESQLTELKVWPGRRLTAGVSAGGLLELSKGKNAVQFGLILSRRSYTPTLITWRVNDPELKGYQQFRYTSFQLPVNYKRTLAESDNWRLSGRLGVSMNVIAASTFAGEEEVGKSFDRFDDLDLIQRSPLLAQGLSAQSNDQLESPDPGFLEGGSIFANANLYVGGGFVLERVVSMRWSIYLSPSFGRMVYFDDRHGVGPTNDRLHSGSLRLGSRYLFGRGRK